MLRGLESPCAAVSDSARCAQTVATLPQLFPSCHVAVALPSTCGRQTLTLNTPAGSTRAVACRPTVHPVAQERHWCSSLFSGLPSLQERGVQLTPSTERLHLATALIRERIGQRPVEQPISHAILSTKSRMD